MRWLDDKKTDFCLIGRVEILPEKMRSRLWAGRHSAYRLKMTNPGSCLSNFAQLLCTFKSIVDRLIMRKPLSVLRKKPG